MSMVSKSDLKKLLKREQVELKEKKRQVKITESGIKAIQKRIKNM